MSAIGNLVKDIGGAVEGALGDVGQLAEGAISTACPELDMAQMALNTMQSGENGQSPMQS
jgi:hypothetical protein